MLHPLKREKPVPADALKEWFDYEDLRVSKVPNQRLVPEDVGTGYPPAGVKRPIRIYRVYDPPGRRREVRAVFDSQCSRSAVLQGRDTFRIHGARASLYKTITQPRIRFFSSVQAGYLFCRYIDDIIFAIRAEKSKAISTWERIASKLFLSRSGLNLKLTAPRMRMMPSSTNEQNSKKRGLPKGERSGVCSPNSLGITFLGSAT